MLARDEAYGALCAAVYCLWRRGVLIGVGLLAALNSPDRRSRDPQRLVWYKGSEIAQIFRDNRGVAWSAVDTQGKTYMCIAQSHDAVAQELYAQRNL